MLGGEIVEGEQHLAVLGQAFDRLVVLRAVDFCECIEGGLGVRPGLGHPQMFWSARLVLPCKLFGSLLRTLAVLCTQQRCSRVLGQTSASAFQKPSAP